MKPPFKLQLANHTAENGAKVGIAIYILLASIKLITGTLLHSTSVFSDGLNNLSDTLASAAILISLKLSQQPADSNHPFDHFKFETLGSLLVSILMFNIGFNVVFSGIKKFIHQDFPQTQPIILIFSLISVLLLIGAYYYIINLARQTQSIGLLTTSKDMLNDILITFGTIIGTIASSFGLPAIDILISIIVGILVILSAFNILKETTFVLSDGFDESTLELYKAAILKHPKIHDVSSIRGRLSGSKVYVDVVIEIDKNYTVLESHQITIEVEKILYYNFSVSDTDVHVEPFMY